MRAVTQWVPVLCGGVALTLAIASPAAAQAKPANASAQCKDGSYSQAKTERGACSGHGGVGTWYGAPKVEEKAAAPKRATEPLGKAAPASTPSTPAAAPAPTKAVPAPMPVPASPSAAAPATRPAPAPAPAPAPSRSSATKAGEIQPRPVGAPETATAQCNDGTFSSAKQHRGACSGHKGVKAWFK